MNKIFVLSFVLFAWFFSIVNSECNYVSFGSLLVAPGYCTGTYNSTVALSYKFTCSSAGDTVTGTSYASGDCSGTATDTITLSSQSSTFLNTTIGFYCTGSNCGNQLTTALYTSTDCSGSYYEKATVAFITNECFDGTEFTCSGSTVTLSTFTDSTCSGTGTSLSVSTGCSSSTFGGSVDIECSSSQMKSVSLALLSILSIAMFMSF